MIILEGPDGCGKSTLVHQLRTHLKLNLRPRFADSLGGPVDNVYDAMMSDLNSGVGKDHLYDRYPFISEPIYGTHIRGTYDPRFASDELTEAIDVYKPLVILCIPSYETALGNVEASDQMPGVLENYRKIWEGYYSFLINYPYQVFIWNYETGNIEDLFNHVGEYINE